MFQYTPKSRSVYTGKCFGKVNETDIDRCIPFVALFDDLAQGEDMVGASSSFSKASLFLVKERVYYCCYPVEYGST